MLVATDAGTPVAFAILAVNRHDAIGAAGLTATEAHRLVSNGEVVAGLYTSSVSAVESLYEFVILIQTPTKPGCNYIRRVVVEETR